jgi:hypothetical protein
MLHEKDDLEDEISEGAIQNGATIAGMLAVRHLLYASGRPMDPDLRITVQLSQPSVFCHAAGVTLPSGRQVVQFRDLRPFLNGVMFSCAVTPGLSKILLELMDFDGSAIRARNADRMNGPRGLGTLVGLSISQASGQWQDGILLGVADGIDTDSGVAGDPDRVIQHGDRLVFVSRTSDPTALPDFHKSAYQKKARELVATTIPSTGTAVNDKECSVLVCGWRPTWSSTPNLRDRIEEIAFKLTPGPARIIFLNQVEVGDFATMMIAFDFVKTADASVQEWACRANRPGVKIVHIYGDAAEADDLEPVLVSCESSLQSIIVLGSVAMDTVQTPRSRDLRVLAILLLIRTLHSGRKPVHVVGENQEDMTSMLARVPRNRSLHGEPAAHDPDFINTQAIVARALCQSLAFPKLTDCMCDLFDDRVGSSHILVCCYVVNKYRLSKRALTIAFVHPSLETDTSDNDVRHPDRGTVGIRCRTRPRDAEKRRARHLHRNLTRQFSAIHARRGRANLGERARVSVWRLVDRDDPPLVVRNGRVHRQRQ